MSLSSLHVYVNPAIGREDAIGDQQHPLNSLTAALQRSLAGSTIYLAEGIYSAATGEQFPIVVPASVGIVGNLARRGSGVVLSGGGGFSSPAFGTQCVAVVLSPGTQLKGITVSNPDGTGIWLETGSEAGSLAVLHCTIAECGREGVFVVDASPTIAHCALLGNRAGGVALVRQARGELRDNWFQQSGFGVVVSDRAAPLLWGNRISQGRCGVVLSGRAAPVLRQNQISGQTTGLAVFGQARPDLGQPQAPAQNEFSQNCCDIRNATALTLRSVGNLVAVSRLEGAIELAASQAVLPLPIAAPPPVPHSAAPQPSIEDFPPEFGSAELTLPLLVDLANHWATPFIRGLMAQRSLGNFPDRTFQPDASLTRAQFAVLINRLLQRPIVRQSEGFRDLSNSYWAAEAIAQADRMGFLDRFPDQTCRPDQPMTRLQALRGLVQGLDLPPGSPAQLVQFADRAQVPSQAATAVAAALQQGLLVCYPTRDRLRLHAPITRAELVVMIYQAWVQQGRLPALPCAYIAQPQRSIDAPPNAQPPTPPIVIACSGHWDAPSQAVSPLLPQLAQAIVDRLMALGVSAKLLPTDSDRSLEAPPLIGLALYQQQSIGVDRVTSYYAARTEAEAIASARLAQAVQRRLLQSLDVSEGGVQPLPQLATVLGWHLEGTEAIKARTPGEIVAPLGQTTDRDRMALAAVCLAGMKLDRALDLQLDFQDWDYAPFLTEAIAAGLLTYLRSAAWLQSGAE